MLKPIVVLAACILLIGMADTPIHAAARPNPKDLLPVTGIIAATQKGRCEVPVTWRDWGEVSFPSRCGSNRREAGTLHLKPKLGKGGVMQLFVQWRIVANNKNKFRCTGPITYWYTSDNLVDHTYLLSSRRSQNLYAATLSVTPGGWQTLDASVSETCQ